MKWCLLGLFLVSCQSGPTPSANQATDKPAPLVVTQPAAKRVRQGGERFSATVEADTRVRLTFNSGGYVQTIRRVDGKGGIHFLGAGDNVRRGDILAELRTAEYRARVNEAEANLGQALAGERDSQASVSLSQAQTAQSRAQVTQALAGESQARAQVRQVEAGLQAATAQLYEANAQMQKSQADWDRAQHLMASQSLTQPDYDSAKLAWHNAQGKQREAQQQVREVQAKLTEAKANVLAASGRVSQARAQVEASLAQEERASAGVQSSQARTLGARSNVEQASVALDDVYLKAPMDGVILTRSVEVGAQVGPGSVGFEMADTRYVLVTFGVPDILVKDLHLGKAVSLKCEALPGTNFEGIIRTIAPEADEQSRVFKIEVRVPNPKDMLKVGMIASLDLANKESGGRQVITVPLGALMPSQSKSGGYQVFVVDGGKARLREVTVGKAQGDQMEIVTGLEEGEAVIVEGTSLVNDGQTVKVKS
jgi:HlyD family secretion protein